jgi:hypothetical protein
MPSIGVENCLTSFLMEKSTQVGGKKYASYNYDFLFFIGNKNHLSFSEIENLITIFNDDIEESEQNKIKKIVKNFIEMVGYSLN